MVRMNRHPKLEPYVQIKTRADITDLILSKVKKLTTPRAAITDLKGEELIKKIWCNSDSIRQLWNKNRLYWFPDLTTLSAGFTDL